MKKKLQNIFNWEKWPFKVIYFPLTFVWVYYMLRSRSVWFFTPSNPTITFGGFEGEGKREMYDQLPTKSYPKTMYVQCSTAFSEALNTIVANGFKYPFIVKPENGMMGLLFRIIENEDQLKRYHTISPVEYIVQGFCDYPIEVSVFYYRFPGQSKGTVSGFIMKEYMQVKGDGVTTLKQLILQHPKAIEKMEEMDAKHSANYATVLPKGETYFLSYAGNHNRGARFINLYQQIDEKLRTFCDNLSNETNKFYYGRYDIKCASIEDLKEGKNFSILEYNGAGAEPNHIYDCNKSLFGAYKEILKHWNVMYLISKYNNQNGYPYWSFKKGAAFMKAASQLRKTLTEKDLELGN